MAEKLRKDHTCLNCGATVHGRYCSECGQENREPRESFDQLIYHFFSDFTHFDSKIFITIKYLILKPGFLTKEYLAGKRVRYIHPIRMYIFISFIYFFTLFLFSDRNNVVIKVATQDQTQNRLEAVIDSVNATIDTARANNAVIAAKALSTTNGNLQEMDGFFNAIEKYNSVEAFELARKKSPASARLTGIYHFAAKKVIAWKEKYGAHAGEMAKEKFLHLIPKVMFVLLPLFAVFLRWFYRRDHLYTDHIIFSLHYHIFAFLMMLVFMLLNILFSISFFGKLTLPLLFIYLVVALRNRYNQSTVRTFFKSIGISVLYCISIVVGLVAAGLLTFITI